jgi:hypothetical protein
VVGEVEVHASICRETAAIVTSPVDQILKVVPPASPAVVAGSVKAVEIRDERGKFLAASETVHARRGGLSIPMGRGTGEVSFHQQS